MSQALPVDQPCMVAGKKVDCNGAPWIEPRIGMDVLPQIAPFDWRDQMAKAKEIVKQAEDDAVNQDDQSNETLNEEGELVEAPENNERKPETNLKRKNAMLNGSTVNALKHVKKMKANVATIDPCDIEEMEKAIKKIKDSISDTDMPEEMQSIVEALSSAWVELRKKLNK